MFDIIYGQVSAVFKVRYKVGKVDSFLTWI